MSAALPLSIVGIVITFLIGVLWYFPLPGATNGFPEGAAPIDETYSVERIHTAANMFSASYFSIVNDLVSYQKNPDYQQAEARYQEMVAYGHSLLPRFQDLEDRLQRR